MLGWWWVCGCFGVVQHQRIVWCCSRSNTQHRLHVLWRVVERVNQRGDGDAKLINNTEGYLFIAAELTAHYAERKRAFSRLACKTTGRWERQCPCPCTSTRTYTYIYYRVYVYIVCLHDSAPDEWSSRPVMDVRKSVSLAKWLIS